MRRKEARELCMQLTYEMIMRNDYTLESLMSRIDEERDASPQLAYMNELITCIVSHQNTIDSLIRSYSVDWEFDRIARVDLAILKLGFAELIYMHDIPSHVTINEAVELAKKFGSETSSSFINGVLGAHHKKNEDHGANENDEG